MAISVVVCVWLAQQAVTEASRDFVVRKGRIIQVQPYTNGWYLVVTWDGSLDVYRANKFVGPQLAELQGRRCALKCLLWQRDFYIHSVYELEQR